MTTITIRPKDPRDLKPIELESLAQELRAALAEIEPAPDVRVEAGDDEHRVAVTLYEVLSLVITAASPLVTPIASEAVKTWMERRSQSKQDQRPRSANLLDEHGNRIGRVDVDVPTDDSPTPKKKRTKKTRKKR